MRRGRSDRPVAATRWRDAHLRRLESFGSAVRMIPEGRVRRPYDESTATLWAIGSTEVYRLMSEVMGWEQRVRAWLADTLVAQLLA